MKFNATKNVCMKFGYSLTEHDRLSVGGQEVTLSQRCLHLGNCISSALTDMTDSSHIVSSFYGHVNKYIANFSFLSPSLRSRLFNTYCSSFYGIQLLPLDSRCMLHICTQWNKAVRRVMQLPYLTHTWILPFIMFKSPLRCQFECRFIKFFIYFFKFFNQ